MTCKIVLIRHGLTYWNVKKKMQGQVNIPLTEGGRQQARDLAATLADYDFDICYSSPLNRSYETAQIVLGNRDVPMIKDERLLEHNYGLLEGTTYRNYPWKPLTEPYNYESHPERYKAPIGGETFDDVYARAQSFIDEVLIPESQTRSCILVGGHGGINCAIMGRMFDIPVDKFWSVRQANCGFTTITYDGSEFKIVDHSPIDKAF